jgi:hypothetical protein
MFIRHVPQARLVLAALLCAALAADFALAEPAEAQPVPGEGGRYDTTVHPGATHVYLVHYLGGNVARVTLYAGDTSGVQLLVHDLYDREIPCPRDVRSRNGALECAWIPDTTEGFKIRVRNGTDAYVGYVIHTN